MDCTSFMMHSRTMGTVATITILKSGLWKKLEFGAACGADVTHCKITK